MLSVVSSIGVFCGISASSNFIERTKGRIKGTTEKKIVSSFEFMQLLLGLAEQSVLCSTRALCPASQASSFEPAQVLLALSEQSALCTFFSQLPPCLAALLRSAGVFSRVLFFARMTLARSAFHCFQIGFKSCKTRVNLADLVKRFQTSISYLLPKFGFDTAKNGPLKVCQTIAYTGLTVRKQCRKKHR